jgi:hypothetical protein
MYHLNNHMMTLLSDKIDVTLVDDNARIPVQQLKSRRRRSAFEGAIKQERRWKSIHRIGDTKDPCPSPPQRRSDTKSMHPRIGDTKDPCLSPPAPKRRSDTSLSLPKRSSDESAAVSHKLGDKRSQMSYMKANVLPLALRSLPYDFEK